MPRPPDGGLGGVKFSLVIDTIIIFAMFITVQQLDMSNYNRKISLTLNIKTKKPDSILLSGLTFVYSL